LAPPAIGRALAVPGRALRSGPAPAGASCARRPLRWAMKR